MPSSPSNGTVRRGCRSPRVAESPASRTALVDWQAAKYDALPLPHEQWGERLLAGLALHGDEIVLDAGAGTGRETGHLLKRLPAGRVVALDASPAMLSRLRQRLGPDPRILPVHADLNQPLPLGERSVDAVASVAALHWLPSHDHVWRHFAMVLRSGGRLRTECGGAGNTTRFLHAADRVSLPRWTFAGVEETSRRLEDAGFRVLDVRLRPDPATLPDDATFEDYLATIMLRGQPLEVVRRVAERLPDRTIDYVRLEVDAVRR